jgi:amino acid transporter
MTLLEAIYGSQYQEISQRGGDGSKGRFNGNLLISVMLLLLLLTVIFVLMLIPGMNESMTRSMRGFSGSMSGKTMGKLLAIPVLFILVALANFTIGTKNNYNRIIERFNSYPEEVRRKANKKVLIAFFSIFGIMILTVILLVTR